MPHLVFTFCLLSAFILWMLIDPVTSTHDYRSGGVPTSDTRRIRRRSISITPEIGDDIVRFVLKWIISCIFSAVIIVVLHHMATYLSLVFFVHFAYVYVFFSWFFFVFITYATFFLSTLVMVLYLFINHSFSQSC